MSTVDYLLVAAIRGNLSKPSAICIFSGYQRRTMINNNDSGAFPWEPQDEVPGGVTVEWDAAQTESGRVDHPAQRIVLRAGMSYADERSALGLALVRLELGSPPSSDAMRAIDERNAQEIAARRLVPIDRLAELMAARPNDLDGWAQALRVSRSTVLVRLAAVKRDSVDYGVLSRRLGDMSA